MPKIKIVKELQIKDKESFFKKDNHFLTKCTSTVSHLQIIEVPYLKWIVHAGLRFFLEKGSVDVEPGFGTEPEP